MHNLNILVVENESLIALELTQVLQKFGCGIVRYATTAKKAYKIMEDKEINLIFMDINLNAELTGIELYQRFNRDILIIYLSAYNDDKTIEQAIQTNPLGYLIKPYKEDDLKALLLLAKHKIHRSSSIALGKGYSFDTKEERLYLNDSYINLGIKELKLLKLLIYARGNIIAFSTIEAEVWEDDFVSNTAVRTLIYRLRVKLEYKLITTVYKQGLKLEG